MMSVMAYYNIDTQVYDNAGDFNFDQHGTPGVCLQQLMNDPKLWAVDTLLGCSIWKGWHLRTFVARHFLCKVYPLSWQLFWSRSLVFQLTVNSDMPICCKIIPDYGNCKFCCIWWLDVRNSMDECVRSFSITWSIYKCWVSSWTILIPVHWRE